MFGAILGGQKSSVKDLPVAAVGTRENVHNIFGIVPVERGGQTARGVFPGGGCEVG